MACYDCEECSKSINYGGKCKRFEYNCPFVLVEKYGNQDLDKIRDAIKNISKSIAELKNLDEECYMEDEIASIEFQVSLLADKVDEETEKEWKEINT